MKSVFTGLVFWSLALQCFASDSIQRDASSSNSSSSGSNRCMTLLSRLTACFGGNYRIHYRGAYAKGIFCDGQSIGIVLGRNALIQDRDEIIAKNRSYLKMSDALHVLSLLHIQSLIFDYLTPIFSDFAGEFQAAGGARHLIQPYDPVTNNFKATLLAGYTQYGIKSMKVINKDKTVRLKMQNNWIYDSFQATDAVVVWRLCDNGQPDPNWKYESRRNQYLFICPAEHNYRFVMWRPEVHEKYMQMRNLDWEPQWDWNHFQKFPLVWKKQKIVLGVKPTNDNSVTHTWQLEDVTMANLENLLPIEDVQTVAE